MAQEPQPVEADCLGDVEKLDYVQPPLSALEFRDERLRPGEAPSNLLLREPRGLPGGDQRLAEAVVPG